MTMLARKILRNLFWPIYQLVFVKLFPLWERLGFHVIPNSFYQPIPDTRKLADDIWSCESKLVGIDMNERVQIGLLEGFSSKFKDEYEALPRDEAADPRQYYINNKCFESVDGEVLYCAIRHFKPRTIIEIGSGYSTLLSAQAILENERKDGQRCGLIAIEADPNDVLKYGFPGLSRLISEKVERVDLSEFEKLGENDILFIDSSHVVSVGNDVCYEFLEILPRLKRGVLVHVHDIFFPMDYPKNWVLKLRRFWSEQYLLQAFLTFNGAFEVLWCASYMHLKHPDMLQKAFSSYDANKFLPGSFWMRRIL